jgi:hypothetical protein
METIQRRGSGEPAILLQCKMDASPDSRYLILPVQDRFRA